MASKKKKNKLKNKFLCGGALKEKECTLKRTLFYTAAQRYEEKRR